MFMSSIIKNILIRPEYYFKNILKEYSMKAWRRTLSAKGSSVRHNYKHIFMLTDKRLQNEIFKITNRCLSFWSGKSWTPGIPRWDL